MSQEPEIGIGLNVGGFVANAKKAQDSVDKVGKTDLSKLSRSVTSLGDRFKSVGTVALGVLGGNLLMGGVKKIAGGIQDMGAAITKGFSDAMEDNKIQARAEQVFGAQNFAFLDETSNKIKSAFGFDDGDVRKAAISLGEMGMSAQQAGASMSLAADIARAKDMSIEASAKLVGKAFQGNEGAAKKLGIQIAKTGDPIKDQARLMDELQKKFGGAAGAYAKNLPPLERAKVAISDMVKNVAAKLIPIVVPFLQSVSNTLTGLVNSEGFSAMVDSLVGGFKMAWNFATQLGTTLLTYGLAFFDIIGQLPGALGRMWDSGKLMDLFSALLGGMFKQAWDGIVMIAKLAWTGLMDGIPALVGFLGKAITDMLRTALGDKLSEMLGLKDVSETFNTMMKDSGGKLAENAGKAFSEWGAKTKDNFAGVSDITKDMLKNDGGLDIGASIDKARQRTSGMLNFGDKTKAQMARDTAAVYGMTGKASQTIGMNQAARKNANGKGNGKLKKAAKKLNRGMSVSINLQSSDRLNPVMATT